MTPALTNPKLSIVLLVIHDLEDIDLGPSSGISDAANEAKTIVPHVEDNAVANLIGRSECLLELSPVGPPSLYGHFIPANEISLSDPGIGLPAPPEITQCSLLDNAHAKSLTGRLLGLLAIL